MTETLLCQEKAGCITKFDLVGTLTAPTLCDKLQVLVSVQGANSMKQLASGKLVKAPALLSPPPAVQQFAMLLPGDVSVGPVGGGVDGGGVVSLLRYTFHEAYQPVMLKARCRCVLLPSASTSGTRQVQLTAQLLVDKKFPGPLSGLTVDLSLGGLHALAPVTGATVPAAQSEFVPGMGAGMGAGLAAGTGTGGKPVLKATVGAVAAGAAGQARKIAVVAVVSVEWAQLGEVDSRDFEACLLTLSVPLIVRCRYRGCLSEAVVEVRPLSGPSDPSQNSEQETDAFTGAGVGTGGVGAAGAGAAAGELSVTDVTVKRTCQIEHRFA